MHAYYGVYGRADKLPPRCYLPDASLTGQEARSGWGGDRQRQSNILIALNDQIRQR